MNLATLPNYLQYLLYKPGPRWDPVDSAHAKLYSEKVWREQSITDSTIEGLIDRIGSIQGKRILDLGGGPGQYSIGFAERGAFVTWHDVSRRYELVVQTKARERGLSIATSLGYLEDARKFAPHPFDVVFVRGCWHYCMNDRLFATLITQITAPEGWIAVWGNNSSIIQKSDARFPLRVKLAHYLNDLTGVKVGHPYPPTKRIANIFKELGATLVHENYEVPYFDDILVRRAPGV